MKTQLTVSQFKEQIQAQAEAQRDFIAPVSRLEATLNGPEIEIDAPGVAYGLGLTSTGHHQLASHLGVPRSFYDRLRGEMPDLLVDNINRLAKVRTEPRLLRTTGTALRAVLSDHYMPIDNRDVAVAVLKGIQDQPGVAIKSSAITEERMWLKAVTHEKTAEITAGDYIAAGFAISNSEVGMGTLRVEPFVERLICKNGLRAVENGGLGIKRRHVGAKLQADDNWAVYADETKRQAIMAILMQIADVMKAAASETTLEGIAQRMRTATKQEITGSVEGAITEVRKVFAFTEAETSSVLGHLSRGGDLTQYGMMNAITRASQDQEDYNRATEFEAFGWELINLSESDWRRIATQ